MDYRAIKNTIGRIPPSSTMMTSQAELIEIIAAVSELKDAVDDAINTLETAIEAAVAKYGLMIVHKDGAFALCQFK